LVFFFDKSGSGFGDLSGHYTLVWQKIAGKWLIISDHSGAEGA
jgi:hypothetical protein